ncbi:probable bifunctional dTTP/UTP pyrophosphatase/methyltransferase protein [Mercenaria mercenaria]|uniref:probable bifunctional dTTP/UTP pyrophosphatase/methyltransferase protein n=1 Tax=Mercenaria mercenaria TaxID=6596 RepID=UPI00234E774C|nr:probable bifunctional dTTP/UTP pyrophosphatase/methyltransferase protein [Mercenaria mercenaria]
MPFILELIMLQPILSSLNSKKIVLASSSPRRKIMLEQIGLKFDIVPSNFEENLKKDSFKTPLDYVNETAKQKTLEVTERLYGSQAPPPDLIIGADTIVTHDDEIFEKPSSRDHAISILSRLNGNAHDVFTSVVLVTPKSDSTLAKYNLTQFHTCTEVYMGELTPRIIQAYVDTGEAMDKAGGYGIQALGSTLISGIKGDYFNVMGFPLHPFAKEVLKLFPES